MPAARKLLSDLGLTAVSYGGSASSEVAGRFGNIVKCARSIDAACQPLAFESKSHARTELDSRFRRPFSPRDRIVSLSAVKEQPLGNILEAHRRAIGAAPAQLLCQVHHLVLEY